MEMTPSSGRNGLLLAAPIALLLMHGCAPPRPDARAPAAWRTGVVDAGEITDELHQDDRLALADNELFFPPLDDESNAVPAYPRALLGKDVAPRTLCMKVAIDERGKVIGASPVTQAPECPDARRIEPEFVGETERAVLAWRFLPAFRCVSSIKDEEHMFDECADEHRNDDRVRTIRQAVSLIYRFSFTQKDGRGTVSVAQ
jgi:hypothetical protein